MDAAKKYLTGPRRSNDGAIEAASACSRCPNLIKMPAVDVPEPCRTMVRIRFMLRRRAPLAGFCGDPRLLTPDPGTCGCMVMSEAQDEEASLITVTVGGKPVRMVPDGKTVCALEHCPSNNWAQEPVGVFG